MPRGNSYRRREPCETSCYSLFAHPTPLGCGPISHLSACCCRLSFVYFSSFSSHFFLCMTSARGFLAQQWLLQPVQTRGQGSSNGRQNFLKISERTRGWKISTKNLVPVSSTPNCVTIYFILCHHHDISLLHQ